MKKAGIVVAAVLCIALVCGGFYLLKNKAGGREEKEPTEMEKIISRNLEENYPKTPREVIKLYNRIITIYYGGEYTDKELSKLADQALNLFDADLAANNPKDTYLKQVKTEAANYKSRKRSISSSSVCDSRDVVFLTDSKSGDNLAYVTSSYFVKEGNSYDRTYQEYVLRKDDKGQWKILTFYQIQGKSAEEEEDD